MKNFHHIQDCITLFSKGGMLIIMDNESRENEGDLIFAAEFCTPQKINFLIQHTGGIICVPITRKRALELGLHTMTARNTDNFGTNFTISCDHISTTTGVSASDRCTTIQALVNPATKSDELSKPGHVFPLIAHPKGLHARKGHTESSIAMCKLAQLQPVSVISELINPDGTMMRRDECERFSKAHQIPIVTIEEIYEYVCAQAEFDTSEEESLVVRSSSSVLNVHNGKEMMQCRCFVFTDIDNVEHVAITYGNIAQECVPTRIHSACFTGNTLYSQHCDCQQQYLLALQKIKEIGYGAIVYIASHEGRGIGLANKMRAYDLMAQGYDTIEANLRLNFPEDMRDYTVAKDILQNLGIHTIDLISNNPKKISFFKDVTRNLIHLNPIATEYNARYLAAKKLKMNHHIHLEG